MGRGTGLGLAAAYGIIKNHQGVILVESEISVGSEFIIYLPASQNEIPRETHPDKDVPGSNETLLLVDDEDMIIDVGRKLLEKLGFNVLTAGSGQEAIEVR